MGYILCITEKPNVAMDVANVIGASKKNKGYYEGNGYRVTWAVGHLVGLAEPEAYGYVSLKDMWDKENPQFKEKAMSELPIFPEEFKLIVLPKTEEQFNIVKSLMNSPQCDSIIDMGDAGPEGHILQWFIRVKAGCNKPVKRFIATSMTEEAILEAMNNLHDIKEYERVIAGEFCKKKADWVMGISMSRSCSMTYNARVDVGRVQSPTLYFVVQRYLAVMKFQPRNYYQLEAEFKEGFKTFWIKDSKDNRMFPADKVDENGRLLNSLLADKVTSELMQIGKGIVTQLETKNKSTDRPQLYDITELERDGNRIYGYTAEEVLQVAQSLYEKHKVTSYPRTDSRFITSDLQPYMEARIKEISTVSGYEEMCNVVLKKGLCIDKRIVDDEKVTDHHAIICTSHIKGFDMSVLNEKEKNILHLIITRMLVAFSDKFKYKETTIAVSFSNGFLFTAGGKIPVSYGWKAVHKKLMGKLSEVEDKDDNENVEEQFFQDISLNQEVHLKSLNVLKRQTTPPKFHTEATLLTAMENAGNYVSGGAILKGKGIGTQATRANIIKSLFDKGYIKNLTKGKTKYVVPTKVGINVIRVLPKELYSPIITADWETKISHIVDGTLTENEFMDDFKHFIECKIEEVKNNVVEGLDFNAMEKIADCPWCGNPVYEGSFTDADGNKVHNVYCSNKECKFSIRKDDFFYKIKTGKDLTLTQIQNLIKNGKIKSNCVNSSNVKYSAYFILQKNEKGYCKLEMEFPNSSSQKGKKKLTAQARLQRW